MAQNSAQSFCLKILVAKEENKVILAESDKDFVDVLFSFMIMPIASVFKLTRKGMSGDIGCLNNLYGNVENLDVNFLQSMECRDVLLNPRSAAEIYCRNLKLNLIEGGCNVFYGCQDKGKQKLNLIEGDGTVFYVCQRKYCTEISYHQTGSCRCGEKLKCKITMPPNSSFFPEEQGVFLKSTARFMITDDFQVIPMSTMTGLTLLTELEKYEKIEERSIKVGSDEVLKLLKCSLRSKTPLSETFLESSIDKPGNEVFDMKYGPRGMNPLPKVGDSQKKETTISLRLIFDKVNNKALYAEVKEDFVNLICSFLTFPLGYIFYQFPCLSFEGCMGNLHRSIQDTEINLFCCEERKEILVNPKLAPGLAYNGHLIGIEEATIPSKCSIFSYLSSAKREISNFKINQGKQNVWEEFIKGPSMFMVTDNMEVKLLSPISVKSLVDKSLVPLSDIGEKEVILGEDKALHLLVASLVSEHALTNTFLLKEPNTVCFDFLRLMWGGKGKGTSVNGC